MQVCASRSTYQSIVQVIRTPYYSAHVSPSQPRCHADTADSGTTGCSGNICQIATTVTFPADNGTHPVALFLHGFQLDAEDYASSCERLASHGYVVVAWDTNEGLLTGTEHGVLSNMAQTLYDWAVGEETLPTADAAKSYLVAGHSLGGKLAGLVAQRDPRVAGAFLIDPVDCDPPGSNRGDYPHVLDNPTALSVPTAIVASEYGPVKKLGQSCAPADCSHDEFWANVPAVTWDVVVMDAGHNKFTDKSQGVDFACKDGNVQRDEVLAITQTMLVAWAETTLRPSKTDISQYTGAWIEGLNDAVTARLR